MDKTRHPKKRAFLAAFRVTGNVTHAADLAQVARSNHYQWLSTDPVYASEFADAVDEAGDRLEIEARRRAIEGVVEPVFYQGVAVGGIRKYSDTLLMFLLKGERPEKFKERSSSEISGPGGGPVRFFNVVKPE